MDTMRVKLNEPILQNEEVVIDTPITLKLKHYVPGITIRYTTDSTDPDSAHSLIYAKNNVKLGSQLMLKARAYKPGWLPSDVLTYQFYHSNFTPDTVILLQPADSAYRAIGSKPLYDHLKGTMSEDKGWLGFHKNGMECLMYFSKPVPVQIVGVSTQTDRGNATLPPKDLELWGGNSQVI